MPIKSHSLDPSLTRSEAASLIDATKVTGMSREITLSRSPAGGVGRHISHEMRAQGGASHNNDIKMTKQQQLLRNGERFYSPKS